MDLIKKLFYRLTLGLVAVAVIFLFHNFGGFTVPASFLLGVGFTIVGLWLYLLLKLAAFQPYSVAIFVNFDLLCDDLGLPRAPVDSENIVYEIHRFTALNAAVFAHYAALSAKTSERLKAGSARSETDYRTSMIFGNHVPCLLAPESFDNSENRDPVPYFFFRPSRNGYNFGIRVEENWWLEHRKLLSTQMRNATVDSDGEIVLCVLPHGYIPDQVRRWESTDPFGLFDLRQRRWNGRLSKQGWKVSEIDPGWLEHRYLSVTYEMLFG